MSRSSRSVSSLFFIVLLIMAAVSFAKAVPAVAADDIRLSSARDFLFAYQPQNPSEDSVLVTAQLFKDGRPIRQAGIPVNFSLTDGRFAKLDETTVFTDDLGMASTRVRSYNSGQEMSERPFLLGVTAMFGGKSSTVTMPITHYISLNGTIKDRSGGPVMNAQVGVLYNRTHNPVNARGATNTTDVYGNYRLDRVPTDLGDMVVYARKGDLETYKPASFPQGAGGT